MEINYNTFRSASYSVPCELCSVSLMCLPLMKENKFNEIINEKKQIKKNELLIEPNIPLTRLFIIHSGSLKSYRLTTDKHEQITGFYFPGDIIGLEAITTFSHSNFVRALTDIQVCELQCSDFMKLISMNEQIRIMAFSLMSAEILHQQQFILLLSHKNAEQRVGTFIYMLYKRYALLGHVSFNIKLSMSRNDIANYLGLTIETISRIFSKMQNLNILQVKGKHILIKNLPALIQFCGGLD